MATWYVNGTSNSAEWKSRLVITLNSQSIANNTSNITATLQFTRTRSSGTAWNGSQTWGTIWMNSVQYDVACPAYNYSSIGVDDWKTICSKTVDIPHGEDGTKVLGVAGHWEQSGVQPSTCSVSNSTITLPTIPRASTVYCTDGSIGSSVTITINRHSSSFTHTLEWYYSSANGVVAVKTAATSIGFVLPTSMYAQIPNSNTCQMCIQCYTYTSDGTYIGMTKCYANVDANNSSPTLSIAAEDVNSVSLALTGDRNKFIKYISNAKITITASPSNSASISSYSTVCGSKSSTSSAPTLSAVDSGTVTTTIVDSRGKKVSKSLSKTLIQYLIPAITSCKMYRKNTLSNEVLLTCNGKFFNASFGTVNNAINLKYRSKVEGGTFGSWTTISGITTSTNAFSLSGKSLGTTYDYKKNYIFELNYYDLLKSYTVTITVPAGVPIIDIGKNDVAVNGSTNIAGNATVGTGLTVSSGGAKITGSLSTSGGGITSGTGIVATNGLTVKAGGASITGNTTITGMTTAKTTSAGAVDLAFLELRDSKVRRGLFATGTSGNDVKFHTYNSSGTWVSAFTFGNNGALTASSFVNSSSLQFKTNVEDISADLCTKIVKENNVKQYVLKDEINRRIMDESLENELAVEDVEYSGADPGVDNKVGLILEDLTPEADKYLHPKGNSGIDVYAMVGILWKTVQEQQKEIEELKSLVNKN